jgi:hypothetical protein
LDFALKALHFELLLVSAEAELSERTPGRSRRLFGGASALSSRQQGAHPALLLKPTAGNDEKTGMPIDATSDNARAQARSTVTRADDQLDASGLKRLTNWIEARAMFIIAVSLVLVISLMGIPDHLSQDGWLALIGGRTVAAHGIPIHDYFSVMTHGARWVDQQWLAQLVMYELTRVGGLQLLTVLYVVITVVAFGGAIAAARDLGGEDLDVLIATLPGAFFYLVTAVSIRTQGFAYPLFVTTVWLLASEVRSPVRRRRVYWIFPMLVLWANLHGSVTLGVGLAGLYGLVVLGTNVRALGLRGLADRRGWAFLLISPLTLLASPYGLGMVHYYSVTLLNPQFSRMVTEWKPITSVPALAAPLFVLILLTFGAVLRVLLRAKPARAETGETGLGVVRASVPVHPQLFDVLTLAALALGAVMAVRNVTWFGLALVVLLPTLLTQLRRGKPAPLRRARVNMILASATAVLAAVVALAVLARPTAWFSKTYPSRAIPTLRTLLARDPNAKILADVHYADWLIWEDPQTFSGRVAYDTSFELLSTPQLEAISDLSADTANARNTVDRYQIWMLYPGNHTTNRALLHRHGVRVITRTHRVIIATHAFPARA